MPRSIVWLISIAVLFLLLAVGSWFVINKAGKARSQLPVLGEIPSFEFVERSGEKYGLDDLKGKVHVVDFIFTNCHGPCPVMALNMGDLYKAFGDMDKVGFLSITVDPERDTIVALQDYAEKVGVTDNRWQFIRGEMNQLVDLSEKGFMLPAEDLPGMHTTKFVLLDKNARIRGYYTGTDKASIDILRRDIATLLRN